MASLDFQFQDIHTTAGDQWCGVWIPTDDLPFLAGHFPDRPIVPGAVLLEVSLAFLRTITGRADLVPKGARRCRFRDAVGPGTRCHLRAQQVALGVWSLVWTLADATVPAVEIEILAS